MSKTFSKDEVRNTVMSGYMGLIKQIDDNLGRLLNIQIKRKHERYNDCFFQIMVIILVIIGWG